MTVACLPLAVTGLALGLLAASTQDRVPRIVWNASASLPVGLYLLVPTDRVAVGEIAAVRLPAELARWMVARGYAGADTLLLKRVAAVSGAQVCRKGAVLRIDGADVARAQAHDGLGRALPAWQGCLILNDDERFLLNASVPTSLDGRYFGPTDASAIIGRATPLWTRGG